MVQNSVNKGPEDNSLLFKFEKFWQHLLVKISNTNTYSNINKLNSGKLIGRNNLENLKRDISQNVKFINSNIQPQVLKTKITIAEQNVTSKPNQFFRVM